MKKARAPGRHSELALAPGSDACGCTAVELLAITAGDGVIDAARAGDPIWVSFGPCTASLTEAQAERAAASAASEVETVSDDERMDLSFNGGTLGSGACAGRP